MSSVMSTQTQIRNILATATLLSGSSLAALTHTGAALYSANCASCHGARAQGGIGPALQ